ncbi:DoxX family protein [Natronococcus pandeyae]|uniref:DoxX family protein n=1 Tax=Natronococcus pandeyae TaxID=2055836 RepID=A0A8J8Q370_9EURY|nr:DoxX family membrane protein [Natronococcus pandeyae]TYL36285.1 DoxX family protein [Natronococcus pandeyae]
MTFARRSRPLEIVLSVTLSVLFLAGAGVGSVTAHEEYVVDDEYDVSVSEFLADALTDPLVVGPLFAGGLAALVAVAAYRRIRPVPRDVAAFRDAMGEYTEYVPWLLRISFGIPLIGAGFGGYFISPALEVDLRLLQVGLGFLLLFGLGTRIVALLTLGTYLVGVLIWPTLLLQLEFVGGLLAIALVGSGKPSADHVLQRMAGTPGTLYGRFDVVYDYARRFQDWNAAHERYLPTVTRLGLGVTFVYLGLTQKILRPGIALAVVDQYDLAAVAPVTPELWVLGAGLAEIALGVALIVGLFTRATAATAIAMFTLTLFALPDDPVLAHVGLFGMASVLLITGSGPLGLDGRLTASK